MMEEYKVVDLNDKTLSDEDREWYWHMYIMLAGRIKNNDEIRNKDNYVNMGIAAYDAFHLLINESEKSVLDDLPVAFAGMYNSGCYPQNTARVLQRAYYSPKVRHKSLATHGGNHIKKALLARYILPKQLELAKDTFHREGVFFSVEFPMRRKSFETIVGWMNEHHTSQYGTWEIHPKLVNTCEGYVHDAKYHHVDHRTCWQNVAIMKFKDDFELRLPTMEIEEWHDKYGKTKR